mgnify:FL=1
MKSVHFGNIVQIINFTTENKKSSKHKIPNSYPYKNFNKPKQHNLFSKFFLDIIKYTDDIIQPKLFYCLPVIRDEEKDCLE